MCRETGTNNTWEVYHLSYGLYVYPLSTSVNRYKQSQLTFSTSPRTESRSKQHCRCVFVCASIGVCVYMCWCLCVHVWVIVCACVGVCVYVCVFVCAPRVYVINSLCMYVCLGIEELSVRYLVPAVLEPRESCLLLYQAY